MLYSASYELMKMFLFQVCEGNSDLRHSPGHVLERLPGLQEIGISVRRGTVHQREQILQRRPGLR